MARKFKTDAEKDAELGVVRGRTDSAASAGESGTITAIQKQQEIYDPNEVVDPVKAAIAAETIRLRKSVDEAITKEEEELAKIIAQAEADIEEAERLAAEAKAAQELAEKQLAEAKALEAKALAGEVIAFNLDPTVTFSDLPPNKQANVSKGMFDGNAAFTALFSSLSALGLEGLVDVLNNIRTLYPEIKSEDALLLLKYDKRYNEPYLKRFEGNRKRMAAGLAPLDDATYLSNEAAYKKIFESYGLKQFANREKYANFIGSDVAPDEVAARVQLVYDRVQGALPQVSKALLQFYPELTTQDLMAYTLDPANQLPVIQRKIQAAEIGGAALAQNLGTSLQATTFTGAQAAPYTNVKRGTIGVETMLKAGTDAAEAAKASAYVADVLPVAENISALYANGYKQYGQVEAEKEAYLGSIEAKKAREALVGRERAEFGGTAGVLRSQNRALNRAY